MITMAGKGKDDPRQHAVSFVYHVEVDPNYSLQLETKTNTADWYPLQDVVDGKYPMAFEYKKLLNIFIYAQS